MASELRIEPPVLRRLLSVYFKAAEDLDAFILDYYKDVHKRFTDGMSTVQKITILMTLKASNDIISKLRQHDSQIDVFLEQIDKIEFNDPDSTIRTISPSSKTTSEKYWLPLGIFAGLSLVIATAIIAPSLRQRLHRVVGSGSCQIDQFLRCVGAVELSVAGPGSVPMVDRESISRACAGFSSAVQEQPTCLKQFSRLYRYLDLAAKDTSDDYYHACYTENQWIACILHGNIKFRKDLTLQKFKDDVCRDYWRACELGKSTGWRACAPLYLNKVVYQKCGRRGSDDDSEAYGILQHLCNVDDIASACDGAGFELYKKKDFKSALAFYRRGCELRPAANNVCPTEYKGDPLQKECDEGALHACVNAFKLLNIPSNSSLGTFQDKLYFLTWAAELGDAESQTHLKSLITEKAAIDEGSR